MVYKLIILFIGASFASLINVIVIRSQKGESFVTGRSHCPVCGHDLSFSDTLPVISYLSHLGKCRYCGCHISFRYLCVEIIGGLLSIITYLNYGLNIKGELRLIVLFTLLAIALYDLDTMKVPDSYLIILFIQLIIDIFINGLAFKQRVLGLLSVSLPMLVMTVITKGFGLGDVFITALCGMLFGYKIIIVGFLLAIFMGSIYSIIILIKKKHSLKERIAFAPVLCTGIIIAAFYGDRIIEGYLKLFGK